MRAKRSMVAAGLVSLCCAGPAEARDTQFWNLTLNTITRLQLSDPGKNEWGPDLTMNDSDLAVDHDERLKITDVGTGVYDVKFTDQSGRRCIVRNVAIKQGAVFTIEEKDLKGCTN